MSVAFVRSTNNLASGDASRGTGRWGLRLGACGLLLAVASGAGCDSEAEVHPFYAARYDAQAGCLEAVTIQDVLEGPDPGRCNQAICWLNHRGEAYVSLTMCDGPPDWARVDAPESGTRCAQALAAQTESGAGQCGADAGAGGETGTDEGTSR